MHAQAYEIYDSYIDRNSATQQNPQTLNVTVNFLNHICDGNDGLDAAFC